MLKEAARSKKTNVFPAPHWPDSSPWPTCRDQAFDQPGFDRPRIRIAVGIEPRQVGVVLRQLLAEIITVWIIVELWIVGFILWRLIRLWRFLWLRRCLGRPAAVAAQRQLGLRILASAAGDLIAEPAFCEVAAANPLGMLLQVGENTLQVPAAADVMADDGVEHVGPIGPRRRSFPHDLLDFLNAVTAAAAVEPVAFARRGLFCCSSFPALTPDQAPLDHVIDVAEFTDRGIECVAGDRQRLVGASEQLSRNRLAVDLQRKLTIERIAVSKAPDAARLLRSASLPDRYYGRL